MPTGLAFRDGALYVVDIDKIYKYENAEASLDKMPTGRWCTTTCRPMSSHGWKYLAFDKQGGFYVPFGPPCNDVPAADQPLADPPGQPENGQAEMVAIGVRNSVGGDVDPRTGDYWFTENARDWISDDKPSDKLNRIARMGAHYGYPYCHEGNMLDPKYARATSAPSSRRRCSTSARTSAPLGMKFYTGKQFPAEYKNNIFIAEHGSWNRHKYQGARIMRVIVDPQGKNAKQEVFASGWIKGDQGYSGRPADILVDNDGSLLVADDWAGAIYRISYGK